MSRILATVGDISGRQQLQDDIEAIRIICDIQDELQILLSILDQQHNSLRSTKHRHWYIWEEELDDGKRTLHGLCQQAKDVDEIVG